MPSNPSISELRSVSPEPVLPEDISKLGVPATKSFGVRLYEKGLPFLYTVQKYSTLPFSLFYGLHLAGVVIGPALTTIDLSQELMSMGRSIYQAPIFEDVMIWGSIGAHVISGILIRGLKMYHNAKVYGKSKAPQKKSSSPKSPSLTNNSSKEKIDDKDYGLGGVYSIFGLGTRKSITSRMLGLTPLAFSGYLLLVFTMGHIFHQRLIPILVDGDSSYIDLSFIAHAVSTQKIKTYIVLPLLTLVSSYHIFSGWNRYLKRFTLKDRKTAYFSIVSVTLLSFVSLFRISSIGPAVGSLATKFDSYLNH